MLVFEPAGSGVGDSDIYMVEFCCRLFRLFDGRDNLQNCLQSTAAYGAAGVRIFARDYCPAECSWKEYIRLTAFLGFRHICRSVLLITMGILGFLIFYIFPPVIVILPGTAVLLSTYLIEPVLNKYTGVREESMDEHR